MDLVKPKITLTGKLLIGFITLATLFIIYLMIKIVVVGNTFR